jgi:threonyl-tRNA synthetase
VRCPQILDVSLWKQSGHWDNYQENMFFTESEKRTYAVKPMNCPGHVQVYNHGLHSYRDLPIRYGEFGAAIATSLRRAARDHARARFTQDDGHIFCTETRSRPSARLPQQAMDGVSQFGFSEISLKIALRRTSASARRDLGQGRDALRRAAAAA